MPAPTFLCIGAQKAGTTWLASLVGQHPEVCVGVRKELHFFDHVEECSKGLSWYESQFDCNPTAVATGEFTPNYLWSTDRAPSAGRRSNGLAERVAQAYPDLDLIVMLRDPADRAVSAYFHHIKKGRIDPSTPILEATESYPSILEHGHYADHLDVWLSLFPRERFLFLVYEDDVRPDAAKPRTIRRVLAHIGVDPEFTPEGMGERPNTRSAHFDLRIGRMPRLVARGMRRLPDRVKQWPLWDIPVTEADRAAIRTVYAPEMDRLETLLGRSLPWPTAQERGGGPISRA